MQYVGVVGALVNNNPNATFRYKTDPTSDGAVIYNQTNGGYRNRTVQIQNISKANYITGGITFDPLTESAVAVYANLTEYPDLVLVSSSIDNTNGVALFNVSRSDPNNPIISLFDNRTNLANIKLLYWNYTTLPAQTSSLRTARSLIIPR